MVGVSDPVPATCEGGAGHAPAADAGDNDLAAAQDGWPALVDVHRQVSAADATDAVASTPANPRYYHLATAQDRGAAVVDVHGSVSPAASSDGAGTATPANPTDNYMAAGGTPPSSVAVW